MAQEAKKYGKVVKAIADVALAPMNWRGQVVKKAAKKKIPKMVKRSPMTQIERDSKMMKGGATFQANLLNRDSSIYKNLSNRVKSIQGPRKINKWFSGEPDEVRGMMGGS